MSDVQRRFAQGDIAAFETLRLTIEVLYYL
jgi:hypothetical protein